ncbi:MAG: hypothetical protein ILNGONEN_01055 [Syntrophorhabdaceae bacterium]|nr:hypothetical protein [Syntrophorhabdaceae bacterium]
MYDEYAKKLIDLLPDLPELDRNLCRRALSAAYFHIVRSRLAIAQDDISKVDLDEIRNVLRRMANALESVAVFDRLNGLELDVEVENACAFVAAESLALLSALSSLPEDQLQHGDPLQNIRTYIAIESALLYMIGGFDVNAASVVREVSPLSISQGNDIHSARIANSSYLLERILAFCRGDIRRIEEQVPFTGTDEAPSQYPILIEEIRIRFYQRISEAIDAYLLWLGGYKDPGLKEAIDRLNQVRVACISSGYNGHTAYADIHHLSSIILAAIARTSTRALVHTVPKPVEGDPAILKDFPAYLLHRARGDKLQSGRPFLWPSSMEYIKDCLPGPQKHTVVTMPTGSGKSFVAELAISHAISKGWVIYLAPTNALVYQIRRDLELALKTFQNVKVRAFVGQEEYTTLSEEQITDSETHFVAVMTPEKCSLAMRLNPKKFLTCSLCVFDECHLLNDDRRGVTADILMAQLFKAAPDVHFVLMSAMISNPNELAGWLNSVTKQKAVPKTVKWKPSRTLRGLLVINKDLLDANYKQAKLELPKLPERRKNLKFDAPLVLIAGLSGPWTMDGYLDFRVTQLPISFQAEASRKAGISNSPQFDSWKNVSSRLLAELFAQSGVPTINFILTSRHHTFSSAEKVECEIPEAIGENESFPSLVEAWLSISDAELGVETQLRKLLRRGITVHSSAMLQPEQVASEWMFIQRKALLMFATGTLAQGLNLPAISVIISGTSMGDPRDIDRVDGVRRADALILNGFGRAGRPGFSNQGIAVLVTDDPFFAPNTQQLDPRRALERYKVLGEPDAAIEVQSPIERFVDHVLKSENGITAASTTELELTTLLSEFEDENNHSGQVLQRTFAAYRKRQVFTPKMVELARVRIANVKKEFLNQPQVPVWMNKAAMKAGVDFFRAWRLWVAYQQCGVVSNELGENLSIIEWLDIFFEVMALLPPKRVTQYLADEEKKTETVLTRFRDCVRNQTDIDEIPWSAPEIWPALWSELKSLVLLYMKGASYAHIAQSYLGLPAEKITSSRSSGPIPQIFGFLRKVIDPLAIDAGCFLAIHEFATSENEENNSSTPVNLQSLPLCIRNGCDSLSTLSWFRFGYRQRVCAHALAKAFPIPKSLIDDAARAKWVRQMRQKWLNDRIKVDEKTNPLLGYTKIVIEEGGGMNT